METTMARKRWVRLVEGDDDDRPSVVYMPPDRDKAPVNALLEAITKQVEQDMMKKFFKEEKKDDDKKKETLMFKGLSKTDIFNLMLLAAPLITVGYWLMLSTLVNLALHFK